MPELLKRYLHTFITYLIMTDVLLCDEMVWMQHPGVPTFLRYLGNQSGFFSSLRILTKEEKKRLCRATITLFAATKANYKLPPHPKVDVYFTSKHQMSKMLFPVIHPERFEEKQVYPKTLVDKTRDYVEVSVNIEGEVNVMDAVPCIICDNYTWYIANGYVQDIYFTVETGPEDKICSLTGILEAPPKPITYCCDPIGKLENKFLQGQSKVVSTKKRTSLCKLDAFHKFRLCSTVYVTWLDQLPRPGGGWHPVHEFDDEYMCKAEVYLSSVGGKHELNAAPVDLLACGIESTPSQFKPNFYITADEFSLRSVFVVKATVDKESGETKFFLHMHFTDVTALTNVMCDNLMVETL